MFSFPLGPAPLLASGLEIGVGCGYHSDSRWLTAGRHWRWGGGPLVSGFFWPFVRLMKLVSGVKRSPFLNNKELGSP